MAVYDYLSDTCKCMSGYVFDTSYGVTRCVSCTSKYGIGATSDFINGGCKCMDGYMVKNTYSGQECVSIDRECKDDYGVMSKYDSLSDKCTCFSGYLFGIDSIGRTQCISYDDWCYNKYGYNSKYNILSDKCECKSDYEFTLKNGRLDCVSCFSKYGLHSFYDYYGKKCECSSGYTLDENSQCVEKQNNVYFKLIEIDTDNKKAVIKSEYDNKYYLVGYGSGCYSNSFKRYLNKQIVINLGTDFNLDINDKIVLQDDDEVCEIRSRERVDAGFALSSEESNLEKYKDVCKVLYVNAITGSDGKCYCLNGYDYNSISKKCELSKDKEVIIGVCGLINKTSVTNNSLTSSSSSLCSLGKVVNFQVWNGNYWWNCSGPNGKLSDWCMAYIK
jgi:hypothetical protein